MMSKFQRSLIIFSLAFLLSGCYPFLYQPPIKQGNAINPTAVAMLKVGMTKDQVTQLLGNPVLDTPLSPDAWHYVYSLREKGKLTEQKQVTLQFNNNRLIQIKP